MLYCRNLEFEEEPNYQFLIDLLQGCMIRLKIDPSVPRFIWNKKLAEVKIPDAFAAPRGSVKLTSQQVFDVENYKRKSTVQMTK